MKRILLVVAMLLTTLALIAQSKGKSFVFAENNTLFNISADFKGTALGIGDMAQLGIIWPGKITAAIAIQGFTFGSEKGFKAGVSLGRVMIERQRKFYPVSLIASYHAANDMGVSYENLEISIYAAMLVSLGGDVSVGPCLILGNGFKPGGHELNISIGITARYSEMTN